MTKDLPVVINDFLRTTFLGARQATTAITNFHNDWSMFFTTPKLLTNSAISSDRSGVHPVHMKCKYECVHAQLNEVIFCELLQYVTFICLFIKPPREIVVFIFLLLLLSLSPLCRVFIHIFPRQTMSLGNTALQLFCRYSLWCLYL